jgi:hypothetical protein
MISTLNHTSIVLNTVGMAMKKVMVPESLQRAGGWCEPAGVRIFPLLEPSMMN